MNNLFKALLIFLLLPLSSLRLSAQEFKVKSMTEAVGDLSAATSQRLDLNGNACALVKVQIPLQGLIFEGNVIGDTQFRGGEYWVYMTEGSKQLQVKHASANPLFISFEDSGFKGLQGKTTYNLSLQAPPGLEAAEVTFKISPAFARLTIDNVEYSLADGSAVIPLSLGEHTYIAVAEGYNIQSQPFGVLKGSSNKIVIELDPTPGFSKKPSPTASVPSTMVSPSVAADTLAFPNIKNLSARELNNLGNDEYHAGNYEKANVYFLEAAQRGYPAAQYNLGFSYKHGQGVDQNYEEAVKWYRKAVEGGHIGALSSLGLCYKFGEGVPQDYKEAAKLFQKASDGGSAYGKYYLGELYQEGLGVTKDLNKAMELLLEAAEMGNNYAQTQIGQSYEKGMGVPQDYTEAVKWYLKAAEEGNVSAQYYMGVCYEEGKGVPYDRAEAIKWYQKAAQNDYEAAVEALKRLN